MSNRDKYPVYFIAKLRKMHQYLCIHPTSSNTLQAKNAYRLPDTHFFRCVLLFSLKELL